MNKDLLKRLQKLGLTEAESRKALMLSLLTLNLNKAECELEEPESLEDLQDLCGDFNIEDFKKVLNTQYNN